MVGHRGRCLCGDVVYELAQPVLRTTFCSCHFCQRLSGGAQMIFGVLPAAALHLMQGETRSYSHISEGSGKALHLHGCPRCSTVLYLGYERWPEMVGVCGGTLEDPSALPMARDQAKQIFLASARPETVVLPGLPAYWGHAATLEGEAEESFEVAVPTAVRDLLGR